MTLNPPSLLLERNAAQLRGKVLFANPEDSFPTLLSQEADVYAWAQSYAVFSQLGSGLVEEKRHFGASLEGKDWQDFDHLVIYQPKAKELLGYLLAVALPRLKLGAQVWLVGDNKSGVKSTVKKLPDCIADVNKFEGAKHCLLFNGRVEGVVSAFVFDDWITSWQQEVAGQSFTLCSLPGVFGHGKLDKGTEILLQQLQQHRFMSTVADARILDFGCGDGIISMWLHQKTGAKLTALDDSALALKATELTFTANNARDAVTTIASNGLQNVKGRFNYVVTNPPFHTGISTDYSIAEQFFAGVKQHLTLNGELFVVANDFLRYAPCIDAALGKHTQLHRGSGFAVYHARQQRPS